MRGDVVKNLRDIVGEDWLVEGEESVKSYLEDETAPGPKPKPTSDVVVVKPANAQEVSEILKLANREKIPVYVRGGATGLVGGCVPMRSSIVLSVERMKEIDVDGENMMAVVGAGVTLGELIQAAERAGLFFPPHPGNEGAQVGGLIACNAGGARAVKTGVMRNYVTGIEVVLPTGEVLEIGGKLVKDNISASKLMHLFIGTEGILGIITKAVIRLSPKYKATATMIVPFDDRHSALNTAPKVLQRGIIPLGLEYVEKEPIEISSNYLGLEWPCKEGVAFLIFILAEFDEETLYAKLEELSSVCKENGSLEPLLAETSKEQEVILKIRSEIYTALKPKTYDILDVCVPPANIGKLLDEIDRIAEKYDTMIPVYGHAGDGNVHPHIMLKEGWTKEMYRDLKNKIYNAAVKMGGVITGEHGIGEIRKKDIKFNLSEEEVELLRKLKKVLDPNNILNPGKVLP